ncbi:hypothetical protein FDX19_01695 [Citrobacter sp. wls619]|uniref:hypothetical protein n=1 Tax=Citrobacter sp. wls619 TaxID=2576432 RepID=UPI0010CA0E17|nr:hypothetical protein [Citrobacter sp. wls619]TKV13905.1 hypothetical protein FDX19_01695 [Citrobacter sp. wls619]
MPSLIFRNGTVSVNDIFVSEWGYEQTNICFYQVISLHGKSTVRIRRIAGQSVITENGRDGCKPAPEHFIDEPLTRRINIHSGKPAIKIDDCERAYKASPDKTYYFTSYH